MRIRLTVIAIFVATVVVCPPTAMAQSWSFPGLSNPAFTAIAPGGPAPPRDLTGAWDPGQAGIAGGENYFTARNVPPMTPLGKEMVSRNKPGHGPYSAKVYEG